MGGDEEHVIPSLIRAARARGQTARDIRIPDLHIDTIKVKRGSFDSTIVKRR